MTRWLTITALTIVALAPALSVGQEPPKSPMPTETITVTEADASLWERYQLLSRLAAAQQDLLRLQNEKTLSEEYAKLDARFRQNYKHGVSEIERKGDQWIPRVPVPPPAK